MTWSYDVATLASSNKDATRFLIGDTIPKDPQLQDEEILLCLSLRSSIWGAAAMACKSIATQFSRRADSVTGELRTLYSSQARAYALKAMLYENESVSRGGVLSYAGGISIQDKMNAENDTDRVPPQYNLGQQDNPLPVAQAGNESINPPDSPLASPF